MRTKRVRRCAYALFASCLTWFSIVQLQTAVYSQEQQNALQSSEEDAAAPALTTRSSKVLDIESKLAALWPTKNVDSDRIIEQLEWTLPLGAVLGKKLLVISSNAPTDKEFKESNCKVDHCTFSQSKELSDRADVVVFNTSPPRYLDNVKNPNQILVAFQLESALNSALSGSAQRKVNWTASYRRDSTITAPYERFVPYDVTSEKYKMALEDFKLTNYALGKNKKIAWFVSNCNAANGRSYYVQELQKHISVDIFGQCGPLKCPRRSASGCFKLLDREYKFFLAFENSNCKDYITEKLYWNALNNRIVPVVMGAPPEDYAKVIPKGSYIHVDDFKGPAELAEYLNKVDKDDDLYNSFFSWKGTGEFINTKFWCRICAMAHASRLGQPSHYSDVGAWWSGGNRPVCLPPKTNTWNSWRDQLPTPQPT